MIQCLTSNLIISVLFSKYVIKELDSTFIEFKLLSQESTAGPITTTPWLKKVPPFKGIYFGICQAMEDFRYKKKTFLDVQLSYLLHQDHDQKCRK